MTCSPIQTPPPFNLPTCAWQRILSFEKNCFRLALICRSFAQFAHKTENWNAPYSLARLFAIGRVKTFPSSQKKPLRFSKLAYYGESYAYVQDGLIRVLSPKSLLHKQEQLSFISGKILALELTEKLVVAITKRNSRNTFYAVWRESQKSLQLDFKGKIWTYDSEKVTFCYYDKEAKAIQIYLLQPDSEEPRYLFTRIPLYSATALGLSENILYVATPGTFYAFTLTFPPVQKNLVFGNSLTIARIFMTKNQLTLLARPSPGKRELVLLDKRTLQPKQQKKMRFKKPQGVHVDDTQIVLLHDDNSIEKRNLETGELMRRMRLRCTFETLLRKAPFPFAAKGNLAALASDEGIEIWDLQQGERSLLVKKEKAAVAIAFDAKGTSLATQTSKGDLLVWQTTPSVFKKNGVPALSQTVGFHE